MMLKVAAGLFFRGGKVLVQQRRAQGEYALHWEFPGGKLEANESWEQALQRECYEELGVHAEVLELAWELTYTAPTAASGGAPALASAAAAVQTRPCLHLRFFHARLCSTAQPQALQAVQLCWQPVLHLQPQLFCPADRDVVEALRTARLVAPT